MNIQKKVNITIKLLFSIFIISFLIYYYDYNKIFAIIKNSNIYYIMVSCLCGIISLYFYSIMYYKAMKPLKIPHKPFKIFKIQLQLHFYALFMPGGTNTVIKWYKFSNSANQPAEALVLMGFTRVLLILSLVVLSFIGLYFDEKFPWDFVKTYLFVIMILTIIVFLSFFSKHLSHNIDKILTLLENYMYFPNLFSNKIRKIVKISTTFQMLNKSEIFYIFLLSILASIAQTYQMLYIAKAVNLELCIWLLLWIRAVSQISAIIPVTISGLGIRELSLVTILKHYEFNEPDIISFSLLIFAIVIVGKGIVGGLLELHDTIIKIHKETEK